MAIDIRASISCSLGEQLISATINDDYVQGNGLVKVSGSAEIVGVVAPAPGTPVTFTYTTPAGVTRTIPRNLLVLSSFANPYTKTTKVELGCALTYLQDLREEINWAALDDPENADKTCEDQRIVTLPIYASSIFDQCLSKLGLTATQNPLTNTFSIAEFDFSTGYVQIISDLLVSENYCGFINGDGVLEVFSLDQTGATGPVIDQTRIIELGPIGVGGVPAETVVVNYSSLKLKVPDGEVVDPDGITDDQLKQKLWEKQVIYDSPVAIPVKATGLFIADLVYWYTPFTVIYTEYATIGGSEYVVRELKQTQSYLGKEAGSYFEQLYQAGIVPPYSPTQPCVMVSETITEYLTQYGIISAGSTDAENNACVLPDQLNKGTILEKDIVGQITTTTESEPFIRAACGCNIPFAVDPVAYVQLPLTNVMVRRTVETRDFIGEMENVTTAEYCVWHLTVQGQQAIAERRNEFVDSAQIFNYLNVILNTLTLNNVNTVKRQVAYRITPSRPAPADLNSGAYADGGDPNNGYRTESKADIELAMGSPSATRRLELSLPYAPDDLFVKTGDVFTATASDAEAKARAYGRVQNALLMGNRSGISIQTAADLLPAKPFSPFVISAEGVYGLYRTNGTGWVMSGEGLIMSTDALFVGGAGTSAGATGDTFFPTAPTVTTLPTAPAVVDTAPDQLLEPIATVGTTPQTTLDAAYPAAVTGDGVQALDTDEFWVLQSTGTWLNVGTNPGPTMTVTTTVPLWNETVNAIGRTRTTMQVTSFNYPLQRLTQAAVPSKTKLVATRIKKIEVPASAIVMAAVAPAISLGAAVRPAATAIAIGAEAPAVATGASVQPPATDVALAALAPDVRTGTSVAVPAVDISVQAQTPVSAGPTGLLLDAPATDITLAAVAPTVATGASLAIPASDITVAALAPSVARTDPNFSSVSLLLHADGTNNSTSFIDSSSAARTITVNGNAKISTAQSQFGGASALFDGTGDSLTVASNAAFTLDGDFTIEFWLYINTMKQSGVISNGATTFTGTAFVIVLNHTSQTNKLSIWNAPSNGSSALCATGTLTTGTWYHAAFVRSGTTLTPYLDGVAGATATTSATFTTSATNFRVGRYWSGDFDGYIDEVRVTKGVARYTSAFTPPTLAFPDT